MLSIIIPAFNEANYLANTLEKIIDSLATSNLKQEDWEIIVCDNNSTDDTAKIAKENKARVIFEPDNQISKARNTGVSIASGDWLLFIDADTYPDKNLMQEILSVIEEHQLIGCGVTVQVLDGNLFSKLRMERLNPFFRLFNLSGGAFILVNKKGFEMVNGFNEGLFAYEEFDFIIRLKKYGKSVGENFKVLHKNPVTTSGRKGAFTFKAIIRMLFSNFIALILFVLYYIFPVKFSEKISKKLLGFWYTNR